MKRSEVEPKEEKFDWKNWEHRETPIAVAYLLTFILFFHFVKPLPEFSDIELVFLTAVCVISCFAIFWFNRHISIGSKRY